MKRILSLLFFAPLAYSCSVAQNSSNLSSLITEEGSKNHLTILASQEYEGRGTGQKGGKMAAEYVAKEFASYGLQPIVNGNSYYQPLTLFRTYYQADNFQIDNTTLVNGKDFYVQADNLKQSFDANEIIFVGYGLQDDKYNELKGVDVKGKIILVINEGEPIDADGNSILTGSPAKSSWSTNRFKRIQSLSKLNPKMILSTSSSVEEFISKVGGRFTAGQFDIKSKAVKASTPGAPVVNITKEVADRILAKHQLSIAEFAKRANTKVQTATMLRSVVKSEMGIVEQQLADPNVLGFLEGTDKKDEIIVIGGHYDHDGISPDGTYFPGADDNGSGTVGVLEIAKAFAQAKKEGKGPRRSVLFIAFAAEEKGLLGSKFYVENPILPLAKTVACLNIDMIGRIDDKHLNGDHNYVHVIGVNKLSTDLKPIVETANKDIQMKLDYDYDDPNEPMRLYYRSDHYNFAKQGIPSLFFFSGLHPHYHTPEDTVDKINFPMMVKREKFIFNVAWDLSTRNDKPKVDMPLDDVDSR